MPRSFYVYILASDSKALYAGVTNDLMRRVIEHRGEGTETHAKKYAIRHLVYFEETPNVRAAIEREKQIKGWRRAKKIALVESINPNWKDLAEGWYEDDFQ